MPNTNTKSYNTVVGVTSRQYLLPGMAQVVLYLILSAMVLLALNAHNIWRYISDQILIPQTDLGPSSNNDWIGRGWHFLTHGVWLQILFWILVGCLVYIFIWFVGNIVANIRNDIVADDYKHPASYNRFKFWESVLARKTFFGVSALLLIIYFVFFIRLASLLAELCYSAVTNFEWATSSKDLLGALISCAVLIYLLVLLAHITANAWRFTFKDL